MKRIFNILICLLFIFVLVFGINGTYRILKSVSTPSNARTIVVIDAGHGGKDCGTIGIDGTEEKKINLEIALALRDFLEVSGINTKMTREGDYELYPDGSDKSRSDLYNRLDFVNSTPNSILISIHQNHYTDESAWGSQIWFSPNDNISKHYADIILNNVKSLLQSDNERINKKSDNSYYILYKAKVPSIMIECGFMSNRNDNDNLKNREYQRKYAYSVLTGICGEI